jgi:hypothetical protein
MDGMSELIANNGVFAAEEEKPRRSMVKRGALLGATLMFICGLFAIALTFGLPSPSKKRASPRAAVLPTAYSEPVPNSGRQFIDTTRMGQQSSITEQTTSRLNKV